MDWLVGVATGLKNYLMSDTINLQSPGTLPPGPSSIVFNTNAVEFLESLVRDYGDVVQYPNPLSARFIFSIIPTMSRRCSAIPIL